MFPPAAAVFQESVLLVACISELKQIQFINRCFLYHGKCKGTPVFGTVNEKPAGSPLCNADADAWREVYVVVGWIGYRRPGCVSSGAKVGGLKMF